MNENYNFSIYKILFIYYITYKLVNMNKESNTHEARERVLDTAEQIFGRKGFSATTLRDVAAELSLTHASLYYHFPGGKEELFAAVTERGIRRHGEGFALVIEKNGPSLRGRLRGIAAWLLSHPPLDLIRMAESDMPALPEPVARKLMDLVYEQMILRLQGIFQASSDAGEIAPTTNAGLMAGAFIGLMESLHSVPEFAVKRKRADMANDLIEILLKGLDYTEEESNERG